MRLLGLLLSFTGSLFVWSVLTGQDPSRILKDLGNPQTLVLDIIDLFSHTHPPAGGASTTGAPAGAGAGAQAL